MYLLKRHPEALSRGSITECRVAFRVTLNWSLLTRSALRRLGRVPHPTRPDAGLPGPLQETHSRLSRRWRRDDFQVNYLLRRKSVSRADRITLHFLNMNS